MKSGKKDIRGCLSMGLIDSSWLLSPANPDVPWENEKMKKMELCLHGSLCCNYR